MNNKIKKILKSKKFKKLFYYSLHGVGTTIISLGSFQIFLMLNIHYLFAFSISWLLANSYAYFATRKKVFESTANTKNLIIREYTEFMFGRFLTYLFNYVGLFVCVSLLNFDPFISNIFLSMIIIVLNYFIGKFIMGK